jgi:formylglycine-generating enzyme required for sulfatase activity
MRDLRSAAIVLAVAATTGAVMSRVAGAVVAAAPAASPPDVASPAVATASPVTRAAASSGPPRDEGERADDSRAGGPEPTPYDEPAPPARLSIPRANVPLQDGMLKLPAGHFVIGSASARAPVNERPAHPAVVASYWMDRTEVTVGAYRACVDAGNCPRPARTSATCTFDGGDSELPISCVSWADADAYCRFEGKRLPTEAEWEYAARGTYAIPFPWGTVTGCATAVTLLSDTSGRSCAAHPARVGTHPGGASTFGVQDMSGNVEEWTADWYAEILGPAPRAGSAHVLRGGGWLSTPSQSRTTSRDWGSALEAGPNVGFRCARDGD